MELRATYRLQLGPQMDFASARELVPYLREMGVSHLYLSPMLQAVAGSTHGYDVIDPTRVSSELGGEQGLRELAAAGLGIIADIVPNHMGAVAENRWWQDPRLRRRFFDIDEQTGHWRRFFDVDELAAVRQEDSEVFDVTHTKVLELVADGVLAGVRVDHPDGLADPAGYLRRLRERGVEHIWVEKILSASAPREALRDWPVEGSVGYDFLDDLTALFVDPAGEQTLSELWAEVSGDERPFWLIAIEARHEQAEHTFARELERLARLAPQFETETLARALSALPVYRTYVEPATGLVSDADVLAVHAATSDERLAAALLLRDRDGIADEFVTRFQQTSPAVVAKGVEDTAFYRYLRLLALNEVGGDPDRFGLSVEAFHVVNAERARRFPRSMLETQTHDTKRSGDARARIGMLAAMAPQWRERVMAWHDMVAAHSPGWFEEYLLFQTLVGVWPIEPDRLEEHLVKALREAKLATSWTEPDERYEASVQDFARWLLAHEPFIEDFAHFMAALTPRAEDSALRQLALKLTCPGVPDIFQGDELWRLSLVDPDNRRPVDWDARRDALARVQRGGLPSREDAKIFLIHRALALRLRRVAAFAGAYRPVPAGPEVCAFLRGDDEVLVVVTVRRSEPIALELPGRWHDVLEDREVALSALGGGWHGIRLLERHGES